MPTTSSVPSDTRPITSNTYLTAEAALGGDLEAWLRQRRSNGCSARRIVELLAERKTYVSRETVLDWCRSLGIPKGQPS